MLSSSLLLLDRACPAAVVCGSPSVRRALARLQTGQRSQPGAGTGALAAVSRRGCPWRVVFVASLSPTVCPVCSQSWHLS